MFDLTAFQRDLLITIAGLDEPHGLKLKEELEEDYDSEIHHGRLYPNLDVLVEDGFVSKGSMDRRTNVYSVTERGEELIQDRLDWVSERFEDSSESKPLARN